MPVIKNVRLAALAPGMVVGHDICNKNGQLMTGQGTVITADLISQFDLWGLNFVPIEFAGEGGGTAGEPGSIVIAGRLSAGQTDEMKAFLNKGRTHKRQALEVTYKILDNLRNRKQIDRNMTRGVVAKLVQEAFNDRALLTSMLTMRRDDSYIFQHSLNSCILAILIGHRLQLNAKQLTLLGEAALLHDVGMTVIPDEITGKSGPLTDDEWFQIKKHPRNSVELISKMENAEKDLIRAVEQHHEREDGSGYPAGMVSRSITLFGKILAVVDVYDAMTSARPYRHASAPYLSVRNLLLQANGELSQEVLKAFIAEMSLHPSGSLVRLNTGVLGMVVRANPPVPLRPILRVIRNEKCEPLREEVIVDLMNNKTDFITCGIFAPELITQLLAENASIVGHKADGSESAPATGVAAPAESAPG